MPASQFHAEASEMSSPQANDRTRSAAEGKISFLRAGKPRVSVVITGWQSAPCLIDCLRSLAAQTHSVPYEVIVSLNEPTSSLVQTLERDVAGVRVVSTSVNAGFAGACNRGAALARGDLLVLLNDDAVVLEGWMPALVAAADQDDQAGAVGSRVLLEDGTIQEEGAVIWADGSTTLLGYRRPADASPDLRLRRVDYCSAASLLVKKDLWEAMGGMDEGYFPAYYEDVDLCLKLAALGKTILLQPRSTVVHREGSSTTLPYRAFLADRNRLRIAARWSAGLALHEPAEPKNPDAVDNAALRAETRPLPIPAPNPLDDEAPGSSPANDNDFLRRQVETLDGYIAWLESTRARVQREQRESETLIGELHAEIDRLHHEAAKLQDRERELVAELGMLQDELDLRASRRRYQMIDWAYDKAMSIPGVPRTRQWANTRRRAKAGPPASS
jgi:GT2 family glycosyltransferase